MEAQAAQADAVPVAQFGRRDPRIRDGDAAKPAWIAFQRVKHDAVVVAVRVALHDHAMREAEMIEQREIFFDRRVRRRVAAAGRERELLRRTEDVRVGVPGAGRRRDGGPARRRDRPGDARRLVCHNGFSRP